MDRCLILGALLLTVTSGCCTVRTYKGPAWPRSEVAHISNIIRIDSTEIKPGCSAEILPGARKVSIGDNEKTQLVEFSAEAGHSYIGRFTYADSGRPFRKKWWFWIEDTRSRKVVGGKKPW